MVHLESLLSTLKAPLPLLESIRGQMEVMEKLVRFGMINFRLFQAVVFLLSKAAATTGGSVSRRLFSPICCGGHERISCSRGYPRYLEIQCFK